MWQQNLLDLRAGRFGALAAKRRWEAAGAGRSSPDLRREEAGGQLAAEEGRASAERDQQNEGDARSCGSARRTSARSRSVARPNDAVEPVEEASQQARGFPSFGFSSSAASAGLSVSALNADRITEIAMVTANCWYSRPVMPGMNAVGMNTAESTSAMPITGPEISSMAFSAASFGDRPSSMWRSTASTTTMASSTTRPMASTRPNSESVLMEKPNSGKKMKVPISETGTASSGISVARQPCRNR